MITPAFAQDDNNSDNTNVDTATQIVDTVTIAESASDPISIWGLIMQADLVVKLVMLILLLASVFTWAVIYDKWRLLHQLRQLTDNFEQRFWSGGDLNQLFQALQTAPQDPMTALFVSGMREWQQSNHDGAKTHNFLQLRIERQMGLQLNKEMDKIEKHVPMLATIGSSAPFIGLFGTVWGIMNSFIAISATKQTNLSVVAPGIAEALFATALGLVAAIPATVAFNKLSYYSDQYANRLQGFTDEFVTLVSRELENNN